jgi:hypothetical protein
MRRKQPRDGDGLHVRKWRYKRRDGDDVVHYLDTVAYKPMMGVSKRVGVCGAPLASSSPVHARVAVTCIACIGSEA